METGRWCGPLPSLSFCQSLVPPFVPMSRLIVLGEVSVWFCAWALLHCLSTAWWYRGRSQSSPLTYRDRLMSEHSNGLIHALISSAAALVTFMDPTMRQDVIRRRASTRTSCARVCTHGCSRMAAHTAAQLCAHTRPRLSPVMTMVHGHPSIYTNIFMRVYTRPSAHMPLHMQRVARVPLVLSDSYGLDIHGLCGHGICSCGICSYGLQRVARVPPVLSDDAWLPPLRFGPDCPDARPEACP